jgi:hypothetical protein
MFAACMYKNSLDLEGTTPSITEHLEETAPSITEHLMLLPEIDPNLLQHLCSVEHTEAQVASVSLQTYLITKEVQFTNRHTDTFEFHCKNNIICMSRWKSEACLPRRSCGY